MKIEEYGKFINTIGTLTKYGESYPFVHYVSGISIFDETLKSKPFSKTNYNFDIYNYEFAIVFTMYLDEEIIRFPFLKSDFISFEKTDNVKIKIRNEKKIGKIIGASGAGLVGRAFTGLVGVAIDKFSDRFGDITDREVDGVVFTLNIATASKETQYIKISCEYLSFFDVSIFLTIAKDNLQVDTTKSSYCYIATLCYGDIMAPEVIKFREFRDTHLLNYKIGRKMVAIYYENAEAFCETLKNKPTANKIIKKYILNPIYFLIK